MRTKYSQIKPRILVPKPSVLFTMIGGAVGSIFMSAILYSASVFGVTGIDYPRLLGGIVTRNDAAALWLGYGLFLIVGTIVFGTALHVIWPNLPGHHVAFRGAALKGFLFGIALWVLSGLLFPLFSLVNRLPASDAIQPGFFAANSGPPRAVATLIAHVAYGIALAILAAMPQGISRPLDLMGWPSHKFGDLRDDSIDWKKHPGRT